MTCGMIFVMRRERRGVLHLDKYSPPNENLFGGKEERKREEEKKRENKKNRKKKDNGKEREPAVLKFTNRGVASNERICTSRGWGSLLLWLIFISEP